MLNERHWQFNKDASNHFGSFSFLKRHYTSQKSLFSSVTHWYGEDKQAHIKLKLYNYCPQKLLTQGELFLHEQCYTIDFYERKSIVYDTLGWHSHYADIIIYARNGQSLETIPTQINHQRDKTELSFIIDNHQVNLDLLPIETVKHHHYRVQSPI